MTKEQKYNLINQIFSPSAPIENVDLFIGRFEQVSRVRDAIEERGQHAVMYGGRGVGKTSLANIMKTIFQDVAVSKVTCNRNDDFRSIWEKAFMQIRFVVQSPNKGIGFETQNEEQEVNLQIPDVEVLDVSHIQFILSEIQFPMLFIFDEFDSIDCENTKIKMADTIKALSDNVPQATILVIGISENVTQLIGEHQSIERCIRQIEMPLMPEKDGLEIIKRYLDILELKIDENIAAKIVEYASGFPNYIHLLCKNATKHTLQEDNEKIEVEHFNWAVNESIESSSHTLREAYKQAVSGNKNQFQDVIFACALVDEKNKTKSKFSQDEVLEFFNRITEKEAEKKSIQYNLGMLCKPERGAILAKVKNKENTSYSFRNPLMKAFIKLKIHQL